jgi:hypothetical protein
MKLLELFSGSGIVSKTFKDAGHEVMTLDFIKTYNPNICCNIMDFRLEMLGEYKPDVVWASPECRCFSVASIGHHWKGGKRAYEPKTDDAIKAIDMVTKTMEIINELSPNIFYIENPLDILWKLNFMQVWKRSNYFHEITYCRYGDKRMKPTGILTNNGFWKSRPKCHNGHSDHERVPRGSNTGTQGLKNRYERSKIPEALCVEILKASEEAYLFQQMNNYKY